MKVLLVTSVMGANAVKVIPVPDDYKLGFAAKAEAVRNDLLIEEVSALGVKLSTEDEVLAAIRDIADHCRREHRA